MSAMPAGAGSDWAAFEALYDAELNRVFAFLLVRTGSRPLAEDLASETFFAAAKHWRNGGSAEVTPAWLTTVARRRLVDHWRNRDAQRRRLGRLVARRVDGDDQADLLDPVASGLTDDEVLEALASLSDRQRQALVLRYLDDLSITEVAEAMDVGYRAAESLLARARRAFTAAYTELAPDGPGASADGEVS